MVSFHVPQASRKPDSLVQVPHCCHSHMFLNSLSLEITYYMRSRLVCVVIHSLPNSSVIFPNVLTWPLSDQRSLDCFLVSAVTSLRSLLPLIWIFPHIYVMIQFVQNL